jgi:predicted dehydrogenase
LKELRIAVIGAGHLGRIHARLLSAMCGVKLVAVVDPLETARESVAAECKSMPVADYRKLLERVDAAVIAAPTPLHHAIATDFLKRGVHLLIEKPLAATVAEGAELVSLARARQAVVQVGHVERFNPALTAATPFLAGPRYLEAVRAGGFTFRASNIGVVLDLMIHDIDVALSLVDSPLSHVEALGLAVLGKHEDVAQARLEFANGCVANLSASRISRVARRLTQVWAEKSFVTIDFGARTASVVEPSDAVLRRDLDVEQMSAAEREQFKDHLLDEHLPERRLEVVERNAIADEQANFVAAIRNEARALVPAEQGQRALEVASRILDQIEMHVWRTDVDGPVGRLSPVAPTILRGPHWSHVRQNAPRREAI